MKRLLPLNNRFAGGTSFFLLGAVCLLAAGCSPRLAPVGTGGLLTRSFANYSQSTVVRSEALMSSEKPADGPKTPVPKKESTRGRSNYADNQTTRSKSQVIAPDNYTTAAAPATVGTPATRNRSEAVHETEVPVRSPGIPKVTEESVSGLKNVTFVTQQQVRPQATTAATAGAGAYSSGSQKVAETRISEVTPPMTKRERRAIEKKRKAEAKRLLAEREAASRNAASTSRSTTAVQQPAAKTDSKSEPVVEDFLPGTSSALAQAVAMPDAGVTGNPVPAFINTPADEKTVVDNGSGPEAITPPTHNFKPNETEHVKFSYYDPFGTGNNRFVVVLNEQRFCYPYPGKFLSGYGQRGRSMHTGVDIKGIKNDTVRAAFAGTVRMSKPYSGYGNCVVIRHKNGLETLYGHNSRNLVRVGDVVRAGDPIALIGRTGRATTEHCHFEVRVQGQHINPALILDYQNHKLRSGVLSVTKRSNGRILAVNRASGLAPSEATDVEDADSQSTIAAGGGQTRLASTSSKGASSAAGGAAVSVYTVKSGDTLWGIARRYGTTVAKICSLNNLDREATLPLGKKLKLR